MQLAYRISRIPKKRGFRVIAEPCEELKIKQGEILEKLMKLPLPDCVHGFVPERSCSTNAANHVGQDYVLRMDLLNFFPSVRKGAMGKVLQPYVKAGLISEEDISEVLEYCFYKDSLPQGAPTSPTLSNLYLAQFDVEFEQMCKNQGWVYSRYADDLVVSGGSDLKDRVGWLIRRVEQRLERFFLSLNSKKTKLMPYYQRQVVNGVCVNIRPAIPRAKREEMFSLYRGFDYKLLSVEELGYFSYVKSVDLHFYSKLLKIMVNSPLSEENVNG
jgi:hypothetical protein